MTVDLAATRDAIDTIVGRLTKGVQQLLRTAQVTTIHGEARLTNHHRLVVDQGEQVQHIEFDHLILATGSRPVVLADLPPDGQRVIDSTGALALRELPASIAVMGGGYIGLELATAFAKLGSVVTIVEATDRLLAGFPPWLVAPVMASLNALGVTVRLETTAEGLQQDGLLVRRLHEDPKIVAAERVVVAVGRQPNTTNLGLEHVGVIPRPDGLLDVTADRRTTGASHVLAIGDITPGPGLAHKATAEAEVAAATIAGRRAAFDPRVIPIVVFCDPELASVGLTLEAARAEGSDAASFRYPLSASGRAQSVGEPTGFVELVMDRADGTILGGHLAGRGVGELAGEVALAIEAGVTAEDLALTVHPHPTMSEAIADAARGLLKQGQRTARHQG